MSAAAQPAQGTTLSYSTDNGVTYIVVGEVVSVNGIGGNEMGMRDTTVLSSTRHTSKATIPNPKEITFEILADPTDTGHQTVRDWADTPAASDPKWKVAFNITTTPNTAVWTGPVKDFDGINADGYDESLAATVTLVRNSAVTWA